MLKTFGSIKVSLCYSQARTIASKTEKESERGREGRSRKSQRHMANKKSKPRKVKSLRSSTMRAARIETETGTESVLPKLQKPNQKLVNFCISINFSCSFCPLPSYHISSFRLLAALSLVPFATRIIDVDLRCFCEAATLAARPLQSSPLPAIRQPYRVSICHIIFMKVAQTNSAFHCSRFHCSLPSRISWKETVTWSFGSL